MSTPTSDPAAKATPTGLPPEAHDFLSALASPTRQRILMLFAHGAELAVGEVAEQAGISQPTASQQLQILRRGGVVASRREGRTVLYRADHDNVMQALDRLQVFLRGCC